MRLEDVRDRVLGEPVDLEVRMELPQLVGDRDVALGVAEADRRGDVQRAPPAGQRAGPGPGASIDGAVTDCLREGTDEVADQQVGEDRMAARDHVVGAFDDHERRAGELRQAMRPRDRLAVIVRAVDEEHRAA